MKEDKERRACSVTMLCTYACEKLDVSSVRNAPNWSGAQEYRRIPSDNHSRAIAAVPQVSIQGSIGSAPRRMRLGDCD